MDQLSRITFFLPADERARLEAVAAREDRNLSQLCRMAVRQILEAEQTDDREPVAA